MSLSPESQTGPPHGNPTYPLLDELEGPLVLGDLEQLHVLSLRRGEAARLPDHVPYELGVFVEAPTAAAVPRLAHILGHLVALVKAHSHLVAQSHGCCSSVAATAEVVITLNKYKYGYTPFESKSGRLLLVLKHH